MALAIALIASGSVLEGVAGAKHMSCTPFSGTIYPRRPFEWPSSFLRRVIDTALEHHWRFLDFLTPRVARQYVITSGNAAGRSH